VDKLYLRDDLPWNKLFYIKRKSDRLKYSRIRETATRNPEETTRQWLTELIQLINQIHGFTNKIRFFTRMVFPSSEFIRDRYNVDPEKALFPFYLHRIATRTIRLFKGIFKL